MRYYQQIDESDCGPACLAMIASYYNHHQTISRIREFAGTTTNGTNIKGMLDAATKIGLKGHALKGNKDTFSKQLPTPFIVTIIDDDNNTHFIIIKKILSKKIVIIDPNPMKKKSIIRNEDFIRIWTGIIILFEPSINLQTKKEKNFFLPFFSILSRNKKVIFFSILASLLLLLLGVITAFFYKYLFDEILFSNSIFSLNSFSLGMIFIILFQATIGAIKYFFVSSISFKIDLVLSISYIEHILKLPIVFFETRKSGEILSRFNDLDKIKETFSTTLISFIIDIITISFSIPLLLTISPRLLLISLISVLFILLFSFIFSKIFSSLYDKAMIQNGKLQSFLFELINGISNIKAQNAEDVLYSKYLHEKNNATLLNWKINYFSIINGFITTLISLIANLIVYWIGANSIIAGTLTMGTLISFNSLLSYFTEPLIRLSNTQKQLQESIIATRRLGEILDLDEEKIDSTSYISSEILKQNINFKQVSFAYKSRRPIFNELSFTIPGGKWTAIVGPSGCGKSTLIKLLLKFYDITKGSISLGDISIDELNPVFLRRNIGYVPQDIFLFSGTIKENISFSHPDASFEEIIEASKKAGAHFFIEQLPKKYNTILGEHGCGLSGGEKQKIVLARALLYNPKILILDEATSNLDKLSEFELENILKKLNKEGITIISIAHRLSTIKECDTIIVMQNGSIIQQGKHNELKKKDGLYQDMLRNGSI